jgi:hypothetical protein
MTMQGAWDDRCYDFGINELTTNVTAVVLCSQLPTTFTEANATYKLGSKTSYTVGSPANKSGGGREVTCPAVSGGTILADGTATHYALIDTVNSRLLAAKALTASQAVTSGNPWSCNPFTHGIPQAA